MRRLAGQAQAQFERLADAGRIGVVAPRHQVAGLVHAPQKIQQPLAVVPSSRSWAKPASCSPALRDDLGRDPSDRRRPSSALPEFPCASSSGVGLSRIGVRPGQLTIGSGNAPPSFCVQRAHAREQLGHDLEIAARLARRLGAFPVPLQPAAGVDQRAVLLGEAGRRQAEHFGLDLRRIDIVVLAEVAPELATSRSPADP